MIGCLDLDSFYVSCEIAKNPSLLWKPVVVSFGEGDRGVVLSASYEARKYGIKSGMPFFKAKTLCPFVLKVKPDFEYYEKVSNGVRELIYSYAPIVEQASIDEFYFSFKGCERLYKNDFFNVIFEIRRKIKEKFKIPSSAGLSSTKCTSKILSKIAKPDGQIYVLKGKEKEFLSELPVEFIPGVGEKTKEKLKILRLEKFKDIQNCKLSILLTFFGKESKELYEKANGKYNEPFFLNNTPKSIGKEKTFFDEKIDLEEILEELFWLTEEVVFKMRTMGFSARKIEVKLKYGDFKEESSSHTFPIPENSYNFFQKKAKEIFNSLYKRRVRIRLIGVSVSNLVKDLCQEKLEIFKEKKEKEILKAMDFLKEKYGISLVHFCRSGV